MSIPCLFTIILLASLSRADELKCKGTSITRGSKAVLQCYSVGDLTDVVWSYSNDNNVSTDARLAQTTVGNLTTLTVTGLEAPEEFTCNAKVSKASFIEVNGTARVNHVVYLVGSSVTLYQPNSVVSCVISDLSTSPEAAYWSTGGIRLSGSGVQTLDGAILTPRIEKFAYTSQEMYLTIDGITSTSQYTCSYEFSDGSVLSEVVYAVLRPTTECEHSVKECKTFRACTGQDLNKNLTCLKECNDCFDYTPLTYHNCDGRKAMCDEYLNDFTGCRPKEKMTALAKYCDMCGWCLDMRFKPASLVLPAITLTALCLLTVLTCYKSIEERNDFLPKVQVTSASPEASKIKSFPFKNGDTVIPNRVVEEKGFLGPSAAVEIHNSNNEGIDCDQIIIDEREDTGDAQSIHEYLASNNNGGVLPPKDESQIVVEGVIEGLLTSAIRDSVDSRKNSSNPQDISSQGNSKESPQNVPKVGEPANSTDDDKRLSKGPFLSQIKQEAVIDGDHIESEKLEKEKTDNEKIVEKIPEIPQVPGIPQVPEQSNGAPQTVVSDDNLLTAVKGVSGEDEPGAKSV